MFGQIYYMVVTCLDVCIIYFISCDCMVNSSGIQYIKNCWVRLLSNYNIKYICTIYTRLDTCLMSFTLQHHSLSLTSSALDHSTTSTPYTFCIYVWKLNQTVTYIYIYIFLYIYINVWKSSQVLTILCKQTKIINKRLKCSTTT
jgi:hypothetical protein